MSLPHHFSHLEGKYEIVRRLKGGGMGQIYLVRHRELDDLRVVKVMRGEMAEDEELRQRFVREARLASQLRHPNIAQIYDFSTDEEGRAFLVMEFIEGVTFEKLVGRTPPTPLGLVVEVACQALAAIGFLHRKDFVHRDIAPDNLMLTRDAEGDPLVKLIDLGIAKSLQSGGQLTSVGTFLGKLRYASPEQLEGGAGEHEVGPGSDLYSFGIVLYELLTGHFPISGTTAASVLQGHMFEPPLGFAVSDPEQRVPEDLRTLVLSCLDKRPVNRPASARELTKRLRAIGQRLPQEADWELTVHRVLREAAAGVAVTPPPGGTTQDRLDREFAVADPSRGGSPTAATLLGAMTPEPAAAPARLAELQRGVAGALGRAAFDEALNLLDRAPTEVGRSPEAARLRAQVEAAAEQRVEALEAQGRQAAERGALQPAWDNLRQLRAVPGSDAAAGRLQAHIDRAQERERQAREQERQEHERREQARLAEQERLAEQQRRAEQERRAEQQRHAQQQRLADEQAARERAREDEERTFLAACERRVRERLAAAEIREAGALLDEARGARPELASRLDPLAKLIAQRRQGRASELEAAFAAALDRHALDEAAGVLPTLEALIGATPELAALQQRLALRGAEQEAIGRRVAAAEQQLAAGEIAAAAELLAALGDRGNAHPLVRGASEKVARSAAARHADLEREIEALVTAGELDRAAQVLDGIAHLPPPWSDATPLRARIDRERAAHAQREQARDALAEAFVARQPEGAAAALQALAQLGAAAAELAAGRQRVEALAREVRREQAGQLLAEAERLRSADQPEEALARAGRAVELAPDWVEATSLAGVLGEEIDRRRRLAAAADEIEERLRVFARKPSRRQARALEAALRSHDEWREQPEVGASWLAADGALRLAAALDGSATAEAAAALEELRRAERPELEGWLVKAEQRLARQLATGEAGEAAAGQTWIPAPLRRFGARGVGFAAGALVVAAIAVVVLVRGWGSEQARTGTASGVAQPGAETPLTGAAAPSLGTVELVALPWANVTAILDAAGKPVELPAPAATTPVLLTLAPGSYRITLANPDAGERTVTVEVVADGTQRQVIDFGSMDADRYFQGLGWQ